MCEANQPAYPEGYKLQYTYDARGNVIETRSISKTPGTPPDDPLGRFIQNAAASLTVLHYDQGNILEERDSDNALLHRYVYGPGVDTPLVRARGRISRKPMAPKIVSNCLACNWAISKPAPPDDSVFTIFRG